MKPRFSRKDLAAFRRSLLVRRRTLAGTYAHFSRDALNGITRRDGDLSSVPSESAEIGTQAFDQSVALDLLANEADTIGQIDEALKHIDEGTYGVCGDCMRPIPLARLKALPFTTLCVKCREAEERQGEFF